MQLRVALTSPLKIKSDPPINQNNYYTAVLGLQLERSLWPGMGMLAVKGGIAEGRVGGRPGRVPSQQGAVGRGI